jgi:hypothetical protein
MDLYPLHKQKHFVILCQRELDFVLKTIWNFLVYVTENVLSLGWMDVLNLFYFLSCVVKRFWHHSSNMSKLARMLMTFRASVKRLCV